MENRRVLMVAYHYPPCRGSSGLQRTLSFTRHLLGLGWEPLVVSADPRAYASTGIDQLGDIPSSIVVRRTLAIDAARHLSFRGRYLGWLAIPDQWISWMLSAVPTAIGLIWQYRPVVIWSTYPIATAHLIGFVLHRITGLPWVADFRDPMTEVDPVTLKRFPSDARVFRVRAWIERLAIKHSAKVILVSKGALKIYQSRYPDIPADKWVLIPNGYDEEAFASVDRSDDWHGQGDDLVTLLHSGVLYPTPDRDPRPFFKAVARLKKDGLVSGKTIRIILRASGSESLYRECIVSLGIDDLVSLESSVPYRTALSEMMKVTGLLLFQGHDSNPAVPAKLYEYIRAKRPILALVDSQGDTASVLRETGVGVIAPLDSEQAIASALQAFLEAIRSGAALVADEEQIRRHSRAWGAQHLAKVFDSLAPASSDWKDSTRGTSKN